MKTDNNIRTIISDRRYPIPVEMRPLWRICLIIVAVLAVSRKKKYLENKKVVILVWMLIRKSRWDEYEEYLCGRSADLPLVSVDTATYKALEYSIAKDLISTNDHRVYVTSTGEDLFKHILDNGIMLEEIGFLECFGKKLTEYKVRALTGG